MTNSELNEAFNFLEKEINQHKRFYFKLTGANEITAYWIHDRKPFARFDIEKIVEIAIWM